MMYILDYDRQLSLIKEMTQLRRDTDELEVYYHHPSTNEMWKSYFPKATGKKRGPKILRTEPLPEKLEERLDMLLKSNIEDNAIGVGIELSVEPQKWPEIIEILDDNYRSYNRKQLSLFLEYLGIEKYESIFDEIEAEPADFDLTKEELKKLSWKSKKIRFKRFWVFW